MKEIEFDKLLHKEVKVEWLDAYGEIGANRMDVKDPSSRLVPTETYGILQAEDDLAILVLSENSPITCDYTVIPKGIITDIYVLKGGR